jgi:hypothetical protein
MHNAEKHKFRQDLRGQAELSAPYTTHSKHRLGQADQLARASAGVHGEALDDKSRRLLHLVQKPLAQAMRAEVDRLGKDIMAKVRKELAARATEPSRTISVEPYRVTVGFLDLLFNAYNPFQTAFTAGQVVDLLWP